MNGWVRQGAVKPHGMPICSQSQHGDFAVCLGYMLGPRTDVDLQSHAPCVSQVAVMDKEHGLRVLTDEQVDVFVKAVEEEKAAAEAAKRGGAGASGAA